MDLQKLEANLSELQKQYLQWRRSRNRFIEATERKIGHDGYTEADQEREIEAFYQQQLAIYNPRLAMRQVLNEVLVAYAVVTAEERAAIRDIFAKFADVHNLLGYIVECAECLETPEDEDAFRLALIAASIENYASDFRDTDMILAELAIAAVQAGIDIERHCTDIAALCSDTPGRGGGFMKAKLAHFPTYAPKARRVVDYDWINGVDLPS